MTKLEKRLRKVQSKINAVLDAPAGDPIWADDAFFNGPWIALIDERFDLWDRILWGR